MRSHMLSEHLIPRPVKSCKHCMGRQVELSCTGRYAQNREAIIKGKGLTRHVSHQVLQPEHSIYVSLVRFGPHLNEFFIASVFAPSGEQSGRLEVHLNQRRERQHVGHHFRCELVVEIDYIVAQMAKQTPCYIEV
jgi:hypothetical protein